ncbi:NUDIX domain-containing protein [Ophiocordyceps camponoti-floridani]|uniref:NUDIX domain-containing protein n=1 Tax=Ophiocordyceps camponoti-floridani TaxID=2030778 RepID=A0A8H4QAE2_9HYPO|nr:NUDIX domain-containing protein [Ophiocordyceps camponoti-floridani]
MPLPVTPLHGVSAIVINAHDQLLVSQRFGSHGAGSWQMPGGHLEDGEGILFCTAREVKEESGLDVRPLRVVETTYDVFAQAHKHYLTWFVLCEMMDADAEPETMEPEKSSGWFWKKPAHLTGLNLFLPLQQLLQKHPTVEAMTRAPGPVIELPSGLRRLKIRWEDQDHGLDGVARIERDVLVLASGADIMIEGASPVVHGCFVRIVVSRSETTSYDVQWAMGKDVVVLDRHRARVAGLLELCGEME